MIPGIAGLPRHIPAAALFFFWSRRRQCGSLSAKSNLTVPKSPRHRPRRRRRRPRTAAAAATVVAGRLPQELASSWEGKPPPEEPFAPLMPPPPPPPAPPKTKSGLDTLEGNSIMDRPPPPPPPPDEPVLPALPPDPPKRRPRESIRQSRRRCPSPTTRLRLRCHPGQSSGATRRHIRDAPKPDAFAPSITAHTGMYPPFPPPAPTASTARLVTPDGWQRSPSFR